MPGTSPSSTNPAASRAGVIIDTSAVFAFMVAQDRHHASARSFVEQAIADSKSFVLLDWVFDETMTLLKARFGHAAAERVGRALRDNQLYRWVEVGRSLERETWLLFQRYADKAWSYTDCAILAVAQRQQIERVFSFDRHFVQMPSVQRVPFDGGGAL